VLRQNGSCAFAFAFVSVFAQLLPLLKEATAEMSMLVQAVEAQTEDGKQRERGIYGPEMGHKHVVMIWGLSFARFVDGVCFSFLWVFDVLCSGQKSRNSRTRKWAPRPRAWRSSCADDTTRK
jgi:hypothetical protein